MAASMVGVGIVAAILLVAVAGLSPVLLVPIAVLVGLLVFLPPFLAARERGSNEGPDVPSTSEAAYDPVTDPSER
jgi:hypothetical protein